jgi:D-inositol-3-phosphate glycosyltransferase
MKILFVLEHYVPHIGGVEVLFKNLAEGLAARGHAVKIITLRLPGTKEKENINGVDVLRIGSKRFITRNWFTLMAIPTAARHAKSFDILHTTTYTAALPAFIAARIAKKPLLITVHEVLGANWFSFSGLTRISAFAYRLFEKIIISLPYDKIIAVSNSTKGTLKGKNAQVIYNGVDSNFYRRGHYDGKRVRKQLGLDDQFVYFFYGRPGVSKGLEYLIQSVPMIAKVIPNSKLLLIMSHDKTYQHRFAAILKMIENLQIKPYVHLSEPVPRNELPEYLTASDCVVIPSLTEGFGFSAAEACAMGRPVIATNVTSLPEVVSGEHIFIKPKNPQAIAWAVKQVYKGQVNQSGIKIFDWEKCIDEYLRMYKSLLRPKRNGLP